MCTRYLLAAPIVVGLALLISLPSPADEAPSKEKIDKLIEQLGSGNFDDREKASKELAAIGAPALEALRKAAKSDDAEIRKRAEAILPKIEMRAESVRILAPKRLHLVYKDTPLGEAVADFQKKSGYSIRLHDPDGKLKERKITLDTGETTFWHALALFCDKAELTEASMEDLMRPPQPPGGVPGAPAGAPPVMVRPPAFMPGMFGMNGQLVLKDGKAKKLPTDDRSAVRIRALAKSDLFGKVPKDEIILPLEVSLEPKLQWQMFQSIHIDKAVDDQDQKLSPVVPQVEGPGGVGGGNPAIALPGAGGAAKFQQMQMQMMARQRMMMGWGGRSQQVPVQLKKGAKDAKTLKELKGVLTAQLLTEARPLITADKLDKAAGKTFKGDEGGSIKIVDVKSEEKQTTIQLEFEQPPFDKVVPAQPNFMPGIGAPIGALPAGVKIPPAPPPAGQAVQPPAAKPPAAPPAKKPPAAQPPAAPPAKKPPAAQPPAVPPVPFPLGGAAGGPVQFMDSMNGLSIQDDKGKALPIDGRQVRMQMNFVQQANGLPKQTMTYTLVCPHGKDKGKPAKVVYLGRKRATVEIPFALKDVPLP